MHLRKKLILIIVFFLVVLSLKLFKINCLFFSFTGIPCPTCKMTRAMLCILGGNFEGYLFYNAMALPVTIVFTYEILCIDIKNKCTFFLHVFSVIILILNMLYYLNRL